MMRQEIFFSNKKEVENKQNTVHNNLENAAKFGKTVVDIIIFNENN